MIKKKLPLLIKILIGIVLGILSSFFFPDWGTRIFITFNSVFSNFLGFIIPLLIIGLVAPGIAELGKGAGKLLAITAAIAYGSTIFAGFFSYLSCNFAYPVILEQNPSAFDISNLDKFDLSPYFKVGMPPIMDVMSALLLSFILGIGLSKVEGNTFKNTLSEFREVIILLIKKVIIPFLPIYIFGIFLEMGAEGQVGAVLNLFIKVIAVIFILHVLLLIIQFSITGLIVKKNPFRLLFTMLPAYMTALGTQSSAATIPITLAQAKKNGSNPEIADFVIPLCATIHLAGSTLKIVACAFAISFVMGMPIDILTYAGFIMMLEIGRASCRERV